MSLSLHTKGAGTADLGQASGVARPTPSPSGAPAPTAVDASRSVGQVNELRSRSNGPRPDTKETRDVVQFSTVSQAKAALAASQQASVTPPHPEPQVGLDVPQPARSRDGKQAEDRVNQSQLQPYKAVFQTLTAKVQFAKADNGDVIVQIVDSRTQEVVRQLPSEAFMKLQNRLEQIAVEGSSDKDKDKSKDKGRLLETAV